MATLDPTSRLAIFPSQYAVYRTCRTTSAHAWTTTLATLAARVVGMSTYRFFTPPPIRAATGLAAKVYAQIAEEFISPAPTFMALSPDPELMAATWSFLRESLLAGPEPRLEKEVVATAVSRVNNCRFCIDAHVVLLHGLGHQRLAERLSRNEMPEDPRQAFVYTWAADPRPTAGIGKGQVATALAFHFINRVVSTLLTTNLLPAGMQRSALVRNVGGRAYARIARREYVPGASLVLLDGDDYGDPVDVAFRALRAAAYRGGELLGELEPAGARLVEKVSLAAHTITEDDVAAWRAIRPGDADLVRLVGLGAIVAVDRIAKQVMVDA